MGNYVLLRFQKARLNSTRGKTWPFPKLSMRYYGPFHVIDKIKDVAFRLELPYHCKLHKFLNVSVLKPFQGDVPKDLAWEMPLEVEELDAVLVLE